METDTQLYYLRQGMLFVSKYAAEFHTLTVQTTWGDAALCPAFYEGLAPRLKNELSMRKLSSTLEGTYPAVSPAYSPLHVPCSQQSLHVPINLYPDLLVFHHLLPYIVEPGNPCKLGMPP